MKERPTVAAKVIHVSDIPQQKRRLSVQTLRRAPGPAYRLPSTWAMDTAHVPVPWPIRLRAMRRRAAGARVRPPGCSPKPAGLLIILRSGGPALPDLCILTTNLIKITLFLYFTACWRESSILIRKVC